MDLTKLQRLIVDALEDVKAQDIQVFDTTHLTELFDRVIVATGTSNRQTKALAGSVREAVKDAGGDVVSVEGLETGEWVLVDCGDAVVHIMQPLLRQYYRLEEIWGDKPVKVKLASGKRGLVKPSEPLDEGDVETAVTAPAAKKAARKAPTKKAAAKKIAVKKTAGKTAAKTATKTAAKKTPAKKSAARKTAADRGEQ